MIGNTQMAGTAAMVGNMEIIVRLLLGAVIGGIIGFERSSHGRPAGFRTHLLVCVASVLIMIVSEYYHYLSLLDPSYVRVDPARLAAGAVTGIGFLGAGVIIKNGLNIQGLTTAACLWMVSAIGLAVGSGLYLAGIVSFILTYTTLWLLRLAENRMPRLCYKFMTVTMKEPGDEEALSSVIREYGSISNVNYEKDLDKRESIFEITIALKNRDAIRNILEKISSLDRVKKIVLRG